MASGDAKLRIRLGAEVARHHEGKTRVRSVLHATAAGSNINDACRCTPRNADRRVEPGDFRARLRLHAFGFVVRSRGRSRDIRSGARGRGSKPALQASTRMSSGSNRECSCPSGCAPRCAAVPALPNSRSNTTRDLTPSAAASSASPRQCVFGVRAAVAGAANPPTNPAEVLGGHARARERRPLSDLFHQSV